MNLFASVKRILFYFKLIMILYNFIFSYKLLKTNLKSYIWQLEIGALDQEAIHITLWMLQLGIATHCNIRI